MNQINCPLTGRALDLRSTGHGFRFYSGQKLRNNLGQVVHTYMHLSPSSTTWYQPDVPLTAWFWCGWWQISTSVRWTTAAVNTTAVTHLDHSPVAAHLDISWPLMDDIVKVSILWHPRLLRQFLTFIPDTQNLSYHR